MTKRVTNYGLSHTPPDEEDRPFPKGICRKAVGDKIYSQISIPASHIPATNSIILPPINKSPSSQRKMHQKLPSSQTATKTSSFNNSSSAKGKLQRSHAISSPTPPYEIQNSGCLLILPKSGLIQNSLPQPQITIEQYSQQTLGNENPMLLTESPVFPKNTTVPKNYQRSEFLPHNPSRCPSCFIANGPHLSRNFRTQPQSFIVSPVTHSISTMHLDLLPSPPNSTSSPLNELECFPCDTSQQDIMPQHFIQNTMVNYPENLNVQQSTHINLDITPSGYTVLEDDSLVINCESDFRTLLETSQENESCFAERTSLNNGGKSNTGTNNYEYVTDAINEAVEYDHQSYCSANFPDTNNYNTLPQKSAFNSASTVPTAPHVSMLSTATSFALSPALSPLTDPEVKSPSWGRYSVLPPVGNSSTPNKDASSVNDSLSLASGNISDTHHSSLSSLFGVDSNQPMHVSSSRSSFSGGRGSRNKRAHSNSPLSAEGIDLNSIIRMSPTSLVNFFSSRSSSSCVSPGSVGDKNGCLGHLSARNSSSSPRSGSGSSGTKRNISHPSAAALYHSKESSIFTSDISTKNDLLELENNMLVLQAMEALEANYEIGNLQSAENSNYLHSTIVPECNNLRILPQSVASYGNQNYLAHSSVNLPPLNNFTEHKQTMQTLHPPAPISIIPRNKPPPTYAEHIARNNPKLEKKNSSESSQPSNSNSSSFESNEGTSGTFSSSTDSEPVQQRMHECRWLDCSTVFHDLEEFILHIEKQHVDQRKGEEFICFWQNCKREKRPFNQRYKLLMHMRVHSGAKPNKCTYTGCDKAFSRLENLKIHMRSHTGERPYSCSYEGCTKTFSNSSDRAKHQKTHQDTRPYICQIPGCEKRYTDPSSLRKHVKASHSEIKEQGRKKIRGGIEELDPKDVEECLIVTGLKPTAEQCDLSSSEKLDISFESISKRSQRIPKNHLGFSTEHYPATNFTIATETNSRSGRTLGSSSQASPSSHHCSPRSLSDISDSDRVMNDLHLPPISQLPQQGNLCVGIRACSPLGQSSSSSISSHNGMSRSSTLSRSNKSPLHTIFNMSRELSKCTQDSNYSNNCQYFHQDLNVNLASNNLLNSISRSERMS